MVGRDRETRQVGAGSGLVAMVLCAQACRGDAQSEASGSAHGSESTDASESDATSHQATSDGTAAADVADTTDEGGDTDPSGPQGAWHTRAPLPGGPRQETGVAAVDGEIYVVGGFTSAGLAPAVEVYDPVSDGWRTAAEFPDAGVHHANTAAVGGRLFVAGYLVTAGFTAVGRTFAYEPSTDAWTEQTAMPVGVERGGAGVAVLQDTVYVLGGLRGTQTVGDAWAYDTVTDAWAPIEPLPGPRDHLVAAGVDGKVYAIGGRDSGIEAHVAHVDVYDPVDDAWSPGPPMPTSRGGMAAAVVSHFVFVAGGEGNTDEASGVFAQFEVLDTVEGTWTSLTPMPSPRHGMGAAAVDGVVYVPGGADVQAFGAVATHEAWVIGD